MNMDFADGMRAAMKLTQAAEAHGGHARHSKRFVRPKAARASG